jgi:hypothetical protein
MAEAVVIESDSHASAALPAIAPAAAKPTPPLPQLGEKKHAAHHRFHFFTRRRLRLGLITLAIAAILLRLFRDRSLSLRADAFASGWVLLILVVFLALYNARKKLSFIPLGRSAVWLQIHIYAGLLSIVVFAAHSHGRLPRGPFEIMLAVLYLSTALSGVVGLAFTRIFPSRLTARGEQILFERIPMFRRKLRELAQITVQKSIAEADTSTLADFYSAHAADFFAGPRNVWLHIANSIRPRKKLLAELADLDRYFNDREREIAAELAELIKAKDDLDHQYALQATLKGWLFVHLPLTYSLLLVAALHLYLVHAFSGGAL